MRSSTSSPSPLEDLVGQSGLEGKVAIVACGAIAQPILAIVARTGLPLDVHPLPPLLHNRPDRIAGEVESLATRLLKRYSAVAVGYADCGTYGAVDAVCEKLNLQRLKGLHCYDVYAGNDRIRGLFEEEPGTYLLTDFLARSFARTVLVELGLDRHPELRDAYFGNYRCVVWLAQDPDDELTALANKAADAIGLPLVVVPTGTSGLEAQLEALVRRAAADATARSR